MLKQKSHLNQADVELLIEMMKLHFVTREEFTQFRSDMMDRFDIVIGYTKPTHDELLVTQSVVTNHTQRLDRIEETLDLPSLAL